MKEKHCYYVQSFVLLLLSQKKNKYCEINVPSCCAFIIKLNQNIMLIADMS